MAVNQIKISGALKLKDDIFKYFKDSLLDVDNYEEFPELDYPIVGFYNRFFHKPQSQGPPPFPDSIYSTIDPTTTTLPISRATYYNYCNSFKMYPNMEVLVYAGNNFIVERKGFFAVDVDGEVISEYGDLQPGWSHEHIFTWSRIKTIEMALFGDISGTGNTLPEFNGLTMVQAITQSTKCSLSLLRGALRHFDNYEGFKILGDDLSREHLSPTGLSVNTSARTFSFTSIPNFGKPEFYEYTVTDQPWKSVTSFTNQSIGFTGKVEEVQVRLASDSIWSPSSSVIDTSDLPLTEYSIVAATTLDLNRFDAQTYHLEIIANIDVLQEIPVEVTITVNVGILMGGVTQTEQATFVLPAYTQTAFQYNQIKLISYSGEPSTIQITSKLISWSPFIYDNKPISVTEY